ncbi:MAG: hypothetical protein C5B59_00070 [Bacteroidetes bacterium]|nr:MAG: hypothetical protein C5B59_00070 [Bacteroidota bacterium]
MFTARPFVILLSFVLISHSSFSRDKLVPGYYINKQGDSIVCKIYYSDWLINPVTVLVEVNNEKRSFNASDIKGFGVYGYNHYKSALTTYHINPISGVDLPEQFLDSVETKWFFLKTIVSGYYNLFELTLPERSYYFVSEGDSAISELIYRAKRIENQIVEDQDYKNFLFDLYHKENIPLSHPDPITNAYYSYSDLRPIISRLNKNHIEINTSPDIEAKIKKNKPAFGIFAGGMLYNFPSTIHGAFATDVKFPSSMSFSGGVNLAYQFPGHLKSIAIGISIGYSGYHLQFDKTGVNKFYQSVNYNGETDYTEHISSSNSFISPILYLNYIFNPLSKTKVYLKTGLAANFSIGSNKDIVTNMSYLSNTTINGIPSPPQSGQGEITLVVTKKTLFQFDAGFGVMMGRHKLEVNYFFPVQLATGDTKSAYLFPSVGQAIYQEDFKMSMLGLSYCYSIFR